MPRGDGTGPQGRGAMTGRGMGFCSGAGAPGYIDAAWGGGYGRGRRGNNATCRSGLWSGRGWRFQSATTAQPGWARFGNPFDASRRVDPEWERRVLNEQAETLTVELEHIKARLAEIDTEESEKK